MSEAKPTVEDVKLANPTMKSIASYTTAPSIRSLHKI